jgi:hypothetical protein
MGVLVIILFIFFVLVAGISFIVATTYFLWRLCEWISPSNAVGRGFEVVMRDDYTRL